MTATDPAAAIEDVMALSPLQQGLFSLAAMSDGDDYVDPYVIAMAADITGALDPGLLRECAAAALARHPNLRASFVHANSRAVQVIPARVDVAWRQVRATGDEVAALEADERRRPFNLDRGPALRFLLIELPDMRWRFAVVAHHIVIDGWSLPLFVGELITLYRGGADPAALPAPPRPYRDYIGWLAGRDQDTARVLWREHLDGVAGPTLLSPALTGTDLAPGHPRRVEVTLDRDASARLAASARERGVTVNTLVQMAWATIVSAFTQASDVVFGVTVSGRPGELTGVETMVGLFINTVPLRVRLQPSVPTGTQCLALQREAAVLRDHGYLGHAELRALAGVGELFDTLLVYENFPPGGLVGQEEFAVNGASFRPAALESLSHFPVTIAAHLTHGELTVLVETLDGALGLISPESLGRRLLAVVQQLIAHWDSPLRDAGVLLGDEAAPGTVPVPVLVEAGPPAPGVHATFTEVARAHPDAVALSWSDGELTYRELDAAADRAAAALIDRGVGPEMPVAVLLRRGPDYVVAMLAVLKAGGAIVPLDPSMPAQRVTNILRQSGTTVVVDEALIADAAARPSRPFRPAAVHPEQAAYVVFTSGTTGTPKGVVGTHRALTAYAADHAQNILRPNATRLGRALHVAHAWSFTFDAAWQPLAALLDGHRVHIIDDDVQRDAEGLVATIDRHGIDMIDITPSMFAQLCSAGLLDTVPLAVLALGGEAIGGPMWDLIREACARTGMSAHNCYGPTETTVEAVVAAISEHPHPTIGRPTGPTRAYVLDLWLRPVPDGVTGELYLAGDQLTRGYLGRPAETATRFVADPFVPGQRMYRTGDVVRRWPNGALAFLGRSDAQVKIRGFRVEPAEISAALQRHSAVRHAHVLVGQERSGPRLTAYVVSERGTSAAELRGMLAQRLPRYMIPHRIVLIGAMPLTAHGKIDEAALAALALAPEASASVPETATEEALAQVLGEVLGAERVDVTADLMQLGLDSITALSVVQAARRRGVALRARLTLDCGSIRELAAAVDAEALAPDAPDEGTGPIALLPNARWLYEYGDPRRLAQTEAIRLPDGISRHQLQTLLRSVIQGHEVLRSRLDRDTLTLVENENPTDILTEVVVTDELTAAVAEQSRMALESLDPVRGRLLCAVWLRDAGSSGVLLLAAHVLALDPASWRIALGELDAGWHALRAGEIPAPVREHTSYRRWSQLLTERAERLDTCDYWIAQLDGEDPELGRRRVAPGTDRARDVVPSVSVSDEDVTRRLLDADEHMPHLLMAAAARTVNRWRLRRGQEQPPPLLAVETHGRADSLVAGVDTSDTVGLMSAVYPLRIASEEPGDVAAAVDAIPGDGIDYGLLRYLRADTAQRLHQHREPQLLLNYLGHIHVGVGGNGLRLDRSLLAGVSPLPEPEQAVRHELTIIAAMTGDGARPVLATQWRALPDVLDAADVAELQTLWQESLADLVS